MDLQQNVQWPGWEIVRKIGSGSFGTVYEIQREVFDDVEKAALKVITLPKNPDDIEEMYNDGYDSESITNTFQGHLKSIVSEYSLMRKMSGSANIVNCDDMRYVQHDDGIGWDIFIKMELLTPLTKVLASDIPEEMVIALAKDICAALKLCERHGIVHRDIKPQNIFLSPNGDYKLGDFGIARTMQKTTYATAGVGTYKYMAPEVYNNQPYGKHADIYSLGLVLYWMLNERRMPFMPRKTLKAGEEEIARDRRFSGEKIPAPAHGSKALQRIVLKACAFDPKERYQSALQMLEDLTRVEGGNTSLITDVSTVSNSLEDDRTVGVAWEKVVLQKEEVSKEEQNLDEKWEKTVGAQWLQSVTPEDPPKKEKKRGIIGVVILAGILLIILLILLRFCGSGQNIPTAPSTEPPCNTTEATTLPAEWSPWQDSLPDAVNAQQYEVEEQILYRSRNLETATSASNVMEGWELFDTISAGVGYGPWSDWSSNKVSATDTRRVENQIRYRYRTKETTTGSASAMSGWELFDTTYTWSNYGAWSGWSTSAVSASNSRQVETKTQYSYRDIWITQEYTAWSAWSGWSTTRQSTDALKVEESRTVYGYYYFRCPNCGAHMHGWGTCWTWAGGCGRATNKGDWIAIWSTVPWNQANLQEWKGTGKYYTYINGELVFKWTDGGTRTEYRYATRSLQNVTNYGSWIGWTDTAVYPSSSREVQTRTVYRYRDRAQIPTYHFERWTGWSGWSADSVSANDTRQVETALFYRYRDQAVETTYWFRRWSEWSEFGIDAVTPNETTEVETKTQYRYRRK